MIDFEVSLFQSFLIVIIYYLFTSLTSTYDYWIKNSVKGPKPLILLGNLKDYVLKRKSAAVFIKDLYDSYPAEKYIGIFKGRTPALILRDLDVIKLIAIKDFNYFNGRGLTFTHEEFNQNIFLAHGEQWKTLRHKLTPSFTTGKIKTMYYLIEKCANLLETHVQKQIDQGIQSEVREIITNYTLEVQGSCLFGIDMGNISQEDTAFKKMGKETSNHKVLAFYLHCMFPGILKVLGVKLRHKHQTDFFLDIVKKAIKEREGKAKTRHDFMDLLIDLKEKGNLDMDHDMEVTDSLLMAQVFIFFIAGFETTAGAISFALHELCLNPEIQEKVHDEVNNVISKYENKLTYEALNEMTYLGMVFDETLRKYPPCVEHYRMCYEDYILDQKLRIRKGDKVNIPVYAIHHDPEYYPDPEKFIPERFTEEEKQRRNPMTYMPFGIGPRICIGARFAKLKSLAAIATIVKSFQLSPTEKTQQNIIFSSYTLTLQSRDGLWMNIEKR